MSTHTKTRSGLTAVQVFCPVHMINHGVFEVHIFKINTWVVCTYVRSEESTAHGEVWKRELIRVADANTEEGALALAGVEEWT